MSQANVEIVLESYARYNAGEGPSGDTRYCVSDDRDETSREGRTHEPG